MSNAAQIWPHLASGEPQPKQREPAQSLSASMYPSLTREAKRWSEWKAQYRRILLKHLREAVRKQGG